MTYGMLLICWHMLWCCTAHYAGSHARFGLANVLYKMGTQNRDFTCEVCHSQNRRGLGANDGEKSFLVCSHLCLFLVSVFRKPLLISHNSK